MRRRIFLVLCLIMAAVAVLSGCKRTMSEAEDDSKENTTEEQLENKGSVFGNDDKDSSDEEDIKQDQATDEPTEEVAEPTLDPNVVQSGDIVFTGRESIVFEYYVEDPTGKTTMKVTMSDGYMRVDVPDIDTVGVMNTNDDTGFVYYKSKFGKVSMSFFNLGSVESINQLNLVCENVDNVENLQRTTLDGKECIYGELEDDGDILKLWYSEEYHILLQYIMDSSDGVSTMKVTSIEEFNGDMSVFEMPAGCIDLGTYDAEGEAFGELTEDLE